MCAGNNEAEAAMMFAGSDGSAAVNINVVSHPQEPSTSPTSTMLSFAQVNSQSHVAHYVSVICLTRL